MRLNGMEIDFKITRLKDAARFDAAKAELESKKFEPEPGEPVVKTIERAIDAFRTFMKTATDVDVLKDCTDLEEAKATFTQFCSEVNAQKNNMPVFSSSNIK